MGVDLLWPCHSFDKLKLSLFSVTIISDKCQYNLITMAGYQAGDTLIQSRPFAFIIIRSYRYVWYCSFHLWTWHKLDTTNLIIVQKLVEQYKVTQEAEIRFSILWCNISLFHKNVSMKGNYEGQNWKKF